MKSGFEIFLKLKTKQAKRWAPTFPEAPAKLLGLVEDEIRGELTLGIVLAGRLVSLCAQEKFRAERKQKEIIQKND